MSRGSRHWLNCTSFAVPLAATCALLSKRRIRQTKSRCAQVSLTEVTALSAYRPGFCTFGSPPNKSTKLGFSSKAIDDKLLTVAVKSACARFSILVPRTRHKHFRNFSAAQRDVGRSSYARHSSFFSKTHGGVDGSLQLSESCSCRPQQWL